MARVILRATLTWNGAVLKCNRPLQTRTALFQEDGVDELHLTYVPALQQNAESEFLCDPVALPKGKRLRFTLHKSLSSRSGLKLIFHRLTRRQSR